MSAYILGVWANGFRLFLQNVFPGLYLVGLSIDSYRVHDSLVCFASYFSGLGCVSACFSILSFQFPLVHYIVCNKTVKTVK